jgi:hypothetical protein
MLSDIRPIKYASPFENKSWTEKELKLLSITNGNVGLKDYFSKYNLNLNGLDKYMSKAAVYYLSDVKLTFYL